MCPTSSSSHCCSSSKTKRLKETFDLLCKPGTDAKAEAIKLRDTSPHQYEPPFNDFVTSILGCNFAWRSRTSNEPPSLVREILFLSQLGHLFAPTRCACEKALTPVQRIVLECLAKKENGRFQSIARLLLDEKDARKLQRMREVLLLCVRDVQLFVPNEFMRENGVHVRTQVHGS